MPQLINWELVSPYNIVMVGLTLLVLSLGLCLIFGTGQQETLSSLPLSVV